MDKSQSSFDFNQYALLQLSCITIILYTTGINKLQLQSAAKSRSTEYRKEYKIQGKILKSAQNVILMHGISYCIVGCQNVTTPCKPVFCSLQKCRKVKTSHIMYMQQFLVLRHEEINTNAIISCPQTMARGPYTARLHI